MAEKPKGQKAALQRKAREQRALERIARHDRQQRAVALNATGDGRRILALIDHLDRLPHDDWPAYVLDRPWLLRLHRDLQGDVLHQINGRLTTPKFWAVGDPLPGQPDTIWTTIRRWFDTAAPVITPVVPAQIVPPESTNTLQIRDLRLAGVRVARPRPAFRTVFRRVCQIG